MATEYIDKTEAEREAFNDQAKRLVGKTEKIVCEYFDEMAKGETEEGKIAQDADLLEDAFAAKEYYDLGNELAKEWIDGIGHKLNTDSGREMFALIKETRFTDWWYKDWKTVKKDFKYFNFKKD
jgi:5'-deoxynucleotidase YfbR-like HD superfamily hydrolase